MKANKHAVSANGGQPSSGGLEFSRVYRDGPGLTVVFAAAVEHKAQSPSYSVMLSEASVHDIFSGARAMDDAVSEKELILAIGACNKLRRESRYSGTPVPARPA